MDKVKTSSKPVVLIAPLDWGLGHATRCIPLIREFLNQGFTVKLAAEGLIHDLYQSEFPEIECIHLKGYRIKYSRIGSLLPLKIILKIPSILRAIRYENKWLQQIIESYKVDVVVSDNRYGLFSKNAKCIFITHQLKIKSGIGKITDRIIQKINYKYIHQFDQCWVPDFEQFPGLAGSLSHPEFYPSVQLHYTGPLSRFDQKYINQDEHLLFLLSGPEPQRSVLEKLLIRQSKSLNEKIVLVRGTNRKLETSIVPDHISIYNLLSSSELEQLIDHASLVVARSGYSTVMDMMVKKKKCILVPTPGQSEQLYLATHLMDHQLAFCQLQKDFSLTRALHMASVFKYKQITQVESTKISGLIRQIKDAI